MGECNRVDCHEPATCAVRLVVPDLNSDETSAEGCLGIELCARHGTEAQDWEFSGMVESFAPLMAKLAAPGTTPDIPSAYVEIIPVTSSEHVEFMAAIGA